MKVKDQIDLITDIIVVDDTFICINRFGVGDGCSQERELNWCAGNRFRIGHHYLFFLISTSYFSKSMI